VPPGSERDKPPRSLKVWRVVAQNLVLLSINCGSVAQAKAGSPMRIWKLAAGNRSVPFQEEIDR
jgi:hypothetical protein